LTTIREIALLFGAFSGFHAALQWRAIAGSTVIVRSDKAAEAKLMK
jgi:hypothetical protein